MIIVKKVHISEFQYGDAQDDVTANYVGVLYTKLYM